MDVKIVFLFGRWMICLLMTALKAIFSCYMDVFAWYIYAGLKAFTCKVLFFFFFDRLVVDDSSEQHVLTAHSR